MLHHDVLSSPGIRAPYLRQIACKNNSDFMNVLVNMSQPLLKAETLSSFARWGLDSDRRSLKRSFSALYLKRFELFATTEQFPDLGTRRPAVRISAVYSQLVLLSRARHVLGDLGLAFCVRVAQYRLWSSKHNSASHVQRH